MPTAPKNLADWSTAVRERAQYTCEKCGKFYGPKHRGLHAAHIFSKGLHKNMKLDPDNGVALCMRCHLYWAHLEPVEFTEWIKQKMGEEKYWALFYKANPPVGKAKATEDE